jgi:hypothetical protein
MHLLRIPRCALRLSRPLSSRRMHQSLQEGAPDFQQELKTIDPKVLDAAMGGPGGPPEEPLLSTFEDGFGYITSAAVRRSLKQYFFVRKVRMCEFSYLSTLLIIEFSWVGLLPHRCGSRCEFPIYITTTCYQTNFFINTVTTRRRLELLSP